MRASQFQKHKIIRLLDLCLELLSMPRVRHVVTQLALLSKGKLQRWAGDFSDSVKARIPFNFKATLQEDHTETLEEDFVRLNAYKQQYTLAIQGVCVNKGKRWNKKHEAILASPRTHTHTHTHTHKHNHTPPFSPAGSLLTHGGLLVWSLWSACRCQSYFLHPASSVQAALAHRQKTHIQVRVSSAHQHPDCSLLNPRRTAHRETGGGVALEPISVRMAKNGIWLFEDVAQRRWITVTSNHKQFAPDATGSPTHDERSDTERKVRALTQRVAVENMGCAAAAKPL